jgi:hypothetical protein
MANYRIGRKRCGVTWSNNVTEGNGRLVLKSDLEFAMDREQIPLEDAMEPQVSGERKGRPPKSRFSDKDIGR